MPQLDFSTFASQIFWLTVSFSLLYLIMARYTLPVIREILQSRQSRIASDLKKAEKLKDEAQAAQSDYSSTLTDAKQRASDIIGAARTKAEKEATKRFAKLEENFAKQSRESDARAKTLRRESIEKLTPVAIDLAVAISQKTAGVDITQKQAEKIVAEVANW